MTDYIVRATAADSQIRAFAATTREMTEYARKVHEESPVACAALGRLMTAGAMMGAMMKGDKDLLTLQIRADGPLRGMTVTADAKGNVKGSSVRRVRPKKQPAQKLQNNKLSLLQFLRSAAQPVRRTALSCPYL